MRHRFAGLLVAAWTATVLAGCAQDEPAADTELMEQGDVGQEIEQTAQEVGGEIGSFLESAQSEFDRISSEFQMAEVDEAVRTRWEEISSGFETARENLRETAREAQAAGQQMADDLPTEVEEARARVERWMAEAQYVAADTPEQFQEELSQGLEEAEQMATEIQQQIDEAQEGTAEDVRTELQDLQETRTELSERIQNIQQWSAEQFTEARLELAREAAELKSNLQELMARVDAQAIQ